MNIRRNLFCLLIVAVCVCWTQTQLLAQASWSLKDNNSFSPTTSKPLQPPVSAPVRKRKLPATAPRTNSSRALNRSNNRSSRSIGSQSSSSSSSSKSVNLDTCIVSFIEDVELPAQESGVLRSMLVKEGQAFQRNQSIARIDDQLYRQQLQQAQMQRDMAMKRATDMTSIRAGRFKVALASSEANKARKLLAKGSKSESEYKRARYSQQVAQEELVAAENEREMAAQETRLEEAKVDEVKVRIRRHSIQTNFDGYVIKIFRDAGEWVQAGEKVLQVARMDRLYVQGNISSKDFNPFEVADKPVTVTLQMARGKETTFKGKIVSIGLEKMGNDLFMVKAEVDNRQEGGLWTLLPGSKVNMQIHLDGQPAMPLGTANMSLDSTRK